MPEQEHNLVKLSLTRPAVEALIGAQPELKVALTQQVCEAILRKHVLGCVSNNPEVKAMLKRLEQVAQEEILKQVGTIKTDWHGRLTDFKLKPEVELFVQERLSTCSDGILRARVEQAVSQTMAKLDETINAKVAAMVPDIVRAKVALAVKKVAEGL